jgi:hypothetical protein
MEVPRRQRQRIDDERPVAREFQDDRGLEQLDLCQLFGDGSEYSEAE